jgi:DNA-binding transcriptional MerR regulator
MPIPTKLYFSISEVSELTSVKPHVLRYWESEFPDLRPKKNRAGNRSYRERDIKMVMSIRDLLYKQGFTIQGARMQLRDRTKRDEVVQAAAAELFAMPLTPPPATSHAAQLVQAPSNDRQREILRTMKRELAELRKRLD